LNRRARRSTCTRIGDRHGPDYAADFGQRGGGGDEAHAGDLLQVAEGILVKALDVGVDGLFQALAFGFQEEKAADEALQEMLMGGIVYTEGGAGQLLQLGDGETRFASSRREPEGVEGLAAGLADGLSGREGEESVQGALGEEVDMLEWFGEEDMGLLADRGFEGGDLLAEGFVLLSEEAQVLGLGEGGLT